VSAGIAVTRMRGVRSGIEIFTRIPIETSVLDGILRTEVIVKQSSVLGFPFSRRIERPYFVPFNHDETIGVKLSRYQFFKMLFALCDRESEDEGASRVTDPS
jgi:hypothetical protein